MPFPPSISSLQYAGDEPAQFLQEKILEEEKQEEDSRVTGKIVKVEYMLAQGDQEHD